MRPREIVVAMMILVSMGLILACSEEKTASLEGNEDIVAVLQKLPECLNNPEVTMEIYTNNAFLKYHDRHSMSMKELTGSKEIAKLRKQLGANISWTNVSIDRIDRKADTAHVEYRVTTDNRGVEFIFNGSAEMVKQGQTWKIKEEIINWR